MLNTVHDLIIKFQNATVGYERKSRVAKGSDRKKFKSLAGLTQDHQFEIQEAFMLAFTRPLMELVTPEFAKALVANARESGRGVGQAFKDSANAFIEKSAALEANEFGGVVFTKAVLEYLNLVNWGYLGRYIEMIAGDIAVDAPTPKTCGRADCKVLEERVQTGWHVYCETCKRTSEICATRPQAVVAWNELEFDGEKIERVKPTAMEALGPDKCVQRINDAGYATTVEIFELWTPDEQNAALNFASAGGRLPEPPFLAQYKDGLRVVVDGSD